MTLQNISPRNFTMQSRALATLPGAVLITIALFFLMHQLIVTGKQALTEVVSTTVINFTRVERDETPETIIRETPERPDKPEVAPPLPNMAIDTSVTPGAAGFGTVPVMAADPNIGGGPLTAPSDGDAIPLVRVPPQYPAGAVTRGIEGWVQLEFTISPTGRVVDPQVIAASPPTTFDRAATRALSRWKYQPKLVDGQPVARCCNQVVITFELDK